MYMLEEGFLAFWWEERYVRAKELIFLQQFYTLVTQIKPDQNITSISGWNGFLSFTYSHSTR